MRTNARKKTATEEDLVGTVDDKVGEEEKPDKTSAYDIEHTNVHAGVSVTWLADHFKMDPTTVKKRISQCHPKGKRRNYLVYELREVVQFLVIPKIDINEVIASMKPSDLPVSLQKDYWAAQISRLNWEEKAGQLWHTDQVFATFGEVAKHIKTSVTLWVENLERAQGLSADQRKFLTQMGDGLLNDIHQALVKIAGEPKTKNVKEEMEGQHDKGRVVVADFVAEEEGKDFSDLV